MVTLELKPNIVGKPLQYLTALGERGINVPMVTHQGVGFAAEFDNWSDPSRLSVKVTPTNGAPIQLHIPRQPRGELLLEVVREVNSPDNFLGIGLPKIHPDNHNETGTFSVKIMGPVAHELIRTIANSIAEQNPRSKFHI